MASPVRIVTAGKNVDVSSDNPLPTTQQLKVDTVIEVSAFDLNASSFSETVTPSYDYIIDNVSFEFTTAESRTITITSDNGSKIYEATSTNLSVVVSQINFGQATGQSFTVAITQTAGACSVDVTANIKNSPVALTADPVLATGTNSVGYVGVDDIKWTTGKGGIDRSTNTLQVINYEHHEIHAGSHFFVEDFGELSINDVYDIQFTTPDSTKWSHFTFKLDCESETQWFIYEGATVNTAGTAVTPINNDRNSSTVSVNTVAMISNGSLALANADTDVSSATLLGRGVVGSGKSSQGNDVRNNEIILKQNTTYCFRAVAIAAGYIDFYMNWYEHQNKN
jgi:hypothetical protein